MIQVEGINKNFGGVRALRGVEAAFAPGEVHALMGENGAGKSTLGKMVAEVYPPSSGILKPAGEKVFGRYVRALGGQCVRIALRRPAG